MVARHVSEEESMDKIRVDRGAIASTAYRSGSGGEAEAVKDMEKLIGFDSKTGDLRTSMGYTGTGASTAGIAAAGGKLHAAGVG
jgi:ABC-type microcin C transport system permease subunit YejB